MQKTFYIVAGPNGAGKISASLEWLPEILNCAEFVNADSIAAGLSPFDPDSQAILAGKLMIRRLYDLAERGVSFAAETTLASHMFVRFIHSLKKSHYRVELVFIGLRDVSIAIVPVMDNLQGQQVIYNDGSLGKHSGAL